MGLKEDLREMSTRLGADLFGVASSDALNEAPLGHRPTDILPSVKSIIILGMKMLDAQTDVLPTNGDYFGVSPRQKMVKGHSTFISQELDRAGYALARLLEKQAFKAYHQMASTGGTDERYLTGLLSLKHIAVQAGLGILGHNSLLITPQYGPRVRLTAILTDAELQPDAPMDKNFCEDCENPCISLCPAKALEKPSHEAPYEINKFACAQYLNTRPTCSVCLKVCPIGNQRIR
ncbi:MAG: epoxyqueuosine reductase [Candidatus Bathyarchaeota archaeon]|nr:MAG: epoxyqueuosine reductase [Candidatus Bathyarchaeota archaeon]